MCFYTCIYGLWGPLVLDTIGFPWDPPLCGVSRKDVRESRVDFYDLFVPTWCVFKGQECHNPPVIDVSEQNEGLVDRSTPCHCGDQ